MSLKQLTSLFSTAALLASAGLAVAAIETAEPPFQVFPADVNLKFQRDRQSLVVRVAEASGVMRDVTAEAKFTIADRSLANGVRPSASGDWETSVIRTPWNLSGIWSLELGISPWNLSGIWFLELGISPQGGGSSVLRTMAAKMSFNSCASWRSAAL